MSVLAFGGSFKMGHSEVLDGRTAERELECSPHCSLSPELSESAA